MSRFAAFVEGFGFRTSTPTFEEGDELEVVVTGREGDTAVVRIGDTVLRVDDPDVPVDADVRVRITDFDESSHEGTAELVEVLSTPET